MNSTSTHVAGEVILAQSFLFLNINAYFPLVPSILPGVVAQLDERLANRTQKGCSALVWSDRRRVPGSFARVIG